MSGHNHYPSCTCGWCKGGRSNSYSSHYSKVEKQSDFIPSYKWDYSYIGRIYNYKSFINPNARCPVCDERVYFYQSPYGGKVYFDQLGPPWTKHGCRTTAKDPVEPRDIDISSKVQPKWIRLKWKPFVCKISKPSSNLQQITLVCDEEIVTCYGLSKNVKIRTGSLGYLRSINDIYIEASLLVDDNVAKTFTLIMQEDREENLIKTLADFTIMEKYTCPATKYRKYSIPCNTIDKAYYETLITDESTSALILTYIFFRFLDNKTMLNRLIKHPIAVKSGMNDVFYYIIKLGIKGFMDNLYKEYRYYEDEVILILKSVINVPLANGIQKIIEKKERELSHPSVKLNLENKGWIFK
jgi:hypothetical protein